MTEYIKKCKVCGKEFIANGSRAEYCSEECKKAKVYTSEHVDEKWGELKIISSYRIGRRLYAECECSCGKNCTVRYDMLKAGNTRSCGHLADQTKFSGSDLTDKINQYGIKAIRATDRRVNTSVIWECECVCGKIFNVPAYYFDKIQSCGCKKQEQCKENGEKNIEKVHEKYYVDGTSVVHIKPGKLFKTNKSGSRGVSWDSKRKKWVAQIVFKGKNYHLGRYEEKEDAASARKEAEKHLYDDFLKWYAEAFPDRWKKLNSIKK